MPRSRPVAEFWNPVGSWLDRRRARGRRANAHRFGRQPGGRSGLVALRGRVPPVACLARRGWPPIRPASSDQPSDCGPRRGCRGPARSDQAHRRQDDLTASSPPLSRPPGCPPLAAVVVTRFVAQLLVDVRTTGWLTVSSRWRAAATAARWAAARTRGIGSVRRVVTSYSASMILRFGKPITLGSLTPCAPADCGVDLSQRLDSALSSYRYRWRAAAVGAFQCPGVGAPVVRG
jgi:hypothetical protein